MEKEHYEEMQLEVIRFASEDVVTTSEYEGDKG